MKLFISQPMAGKTDKEILDERERVLRNVKELFPDKEIEVIDSFFDGEPKTPLWCLGQADIAYFCKDWEKYRGCCIEHECCVRYSIKHVEE